MDQLVKEIQDELRLRILEEGIPRIEKCLSMISEEEIWNWPNEEITSIGNMILHLNGNVRQWFLESFCSISYTRERDLEFSSRKTHKKSELIDILNSLSFDIEYNIYKINYNLLINRILVQSHFNVSGFGIINHITEHFSYHVGQIATLTKLYKSKDLGFYDDLDL